MPFNTPSFLRTFRSYFPASGNKEEKLNFVKHDYQGENTEMENFGNGTSDSTLKPLSTGTGSHTSEDTEPCDETDLVESDVLGEGRDKITEWQAGWNVTNAIQGMFIVSFPYAVHQGGYWAVFAMVIVAYVCCYTGKILVDCLYEENSMGVRVRVRNSYVSIAQEVWGKRIGAIVVNTAQLIELLMTCILYILLCGDLMVGSFPESSFDLASWTMIACVFILPCAFLTTLRHVSWLSFWCTVAHMFINGIILVYCLTKASEWKWSAVKLNPDIWTFPISLGIVVFSYTSQIFLPTLEGNLVNRGKFKCMLYWTHVAAAIFKALFSYIGYITFGEDTKEVVTNNLPTSLKIVVNMFLIAKAILSYPLPYYAAVELIEEALFRGKPRTILPSCFDVDRTLKVWGVILRILLVVFTLVLAIYIPHFALLMGLIGSFTGTMLSFVWPCVFHIKLKRHTLSWPVLIWEVIVILMGLFFGSIGLYYSAHALVRAFRGQSPTPFRGHLGAVTKSSSI